jgi:hypothetical protein
VLARRALTVNLTDVDGAAASTIAAQNSQSGVSVASNVPDSRTCRAAARAVEQRAGSLGHVGQERCWAVPGTGGWSRPRHATLDAGGQSLAALGGGHDRLDDENNPHGSKEARYPMS